MDEAKIAKQKYISVLVGRLDAPNQTFLVDCHPLDSGSNVNSSIILHTVDDILRQVEIKRKNFSLFLTDVARYMSLAGKTLKELYLSLMHVTCAAHLLHNCAMRVRAHFKNIDEIIATIKAATIKNKDRKKDFHDADLPSPPDPVITRWAAWLRAAVYYSENLPAVRTDSRTNTPGQIPTGQIPTGHIPTGQLPPLQNTPWTYTHHKMKCEEKP